jgi:hypothetical protein
MGPRPSHPHGTPPLSPPSDPTPLTPMGPTPLTPWDQPGRARVPRARAVAAHPVRTRAGRRAAHFRPHPARPPAFQGGRGNPGGGGGTLWGGGRAKGGEAGEVRHLTSQEAGVTRTVGLPTRGGAAMKLRRCQQECRIPHTAQTSRPGVYSIGVPVPWGRKPLHLQPAPCTVHAPRHLASWCPGRCGETIKSSKAV